MNKFDRFIARAEEYHRYDGVFDKMMWRFGKWFIVIAMPFSKTFWWYKLWATPTLWLWVLLMITYGFCAFFCFVDVYKFAKLIFGNPEDEGDSGDKTCA